MTTRTRTVRPSCPSRLVSSGVSGLQSFPQPPHTLRRELTERLTELATADVTEVPVVLDTLLNGSVVDVLAACGKTGGGGVGRSDRMEWVLRQDEWRVLARRSPLRKLQTACNSGRHSWGHLRGPAGDRRLHFYFDR